MDRSFVCSNFISISCNNDSQNNKIISDEIKKIEDLYKKYISGDFKCTRQEGAIIINNYNSRRKIGSLL